MARGLVDWIIVAYDRIQRLVFVNLFSPYMSPWPAQGQFYVYISGPSLVRKSQYILSQLRLQTENYMRSK